MDTTVNHIAHKILSKTSIPEEEKFGSVIALLMVISLCFTAIRIIQECNNNSDNINSDEEIYYAMQKFCKQRTLAKWRLRKEMRKFMNRNQYIKYRAELESSIIDVAEHLSISDTKSLVENMNA